MVMTRHDNQGMKEVLARMQAMMDGQIISMGGAGYDVIYSPDTKQIARCWRITDDVPANFISEPSMDNTRAWSIPLIFGQPVDTAVRPSTIITGMSYLLRGGSATFMFNNVIWKDFRWNHAECLPTTGGRSVNLLSFIEFTAMCAIIGEQNA